jgi:hypothetical protein
VIRTTLAVVSSRRTTTLSRIKLAKVRRDLAAVSPAPSSEEASGEAPLVVEIEALTEADQLGAPRPAPAPPPEPSVEVEVDFETEPDAAAVPEGTAVPARHERPTASTRYVWIALAVCAAAALVTVLVLTQ